MQTPPPASPMASKPRFTRTYTLLSLLLTFLLAAMAYSAWNGGEPSPASAFGPRTDALVTAVAVRQSVDGGKRSYHPLVTVEWPKGSGLSRALSGLEPSFYSGNETKAEAIIARYKVGQTTQVRVVEDRPVADRTDIFRAGHVIFLSLFSLLALSFTYLFFHAHRTRRRPKA